MHEAQTSTNDSTLSAIDAGADAASAGAGFLRTSGNTPSPQLWTTAAVIQRVIRRFSLLREGLEQHSRTAVFSAALVPLSERGIIHRAPPQALVGKRATGPKVQAMSLKVSTFTAVSTFGLALAALFASSDAHAQSCTTASSHISRAGYDTYRGAAASSNSLLRAYASSVYDVAALNSATFDGTGFTDAELGQLYSGADGGAGFQSTVSTSGVSGTFTLSNANTDGALSGLISRSCSGAVITVNASGIVDPGKISAIDASISKVDFLTNMPATMTITAAATEITGSIAG
ncbi:MAG: hypothetical protein RIT24_1195, partial [Planctomycetota bacterium]